MSAAKPSSGSCFTRTCFLSPFTSLFESTSSLQRISSIALGSRFETAVGSSQSAPSHRWFVHIDVTERCCPSLLFDHSIASPSASSLFVLDG